MARSARRVTGTIKLIPDLAAVLSPDSPGGSQGREALPGPQPLTRARPQPARLRGPGGRVGTGRPRGAPALREQPPSLRGWQRVTALPHLLGKAATHPRE